MAPFTAIVDGEHILEVLKNGTPNDRRQLVEALPDNKMRDASLGLVCSDNPSIVVLGLTSMIIPYCAGQNLAVGAALAHAVHSYALEIFEKGGSHGLLPMTMSNLAYQYVNALNSLGRFDEVLAFTDQYIPYYEKLNEAQNLPSIKAARINALINVRRIDEADEMLKDSHLRGNWATDIEIKRLETQVALLKDSITNVRRAITPEQSRAASLDTMLRAVQSAIGQTVELKDDRENLLKALDSFDKNKKLDVSSPTGFRALSELLDEGEAFLAGGRQEAGEWAIKKKIRDASAIFVLEASPAVDKLERSLTSLTEALRMAEVGNLIAEQNDALWGIYLCHSRLKEPSEAADALLRLQKNLEAVRGGIKNPVERGGIFANYPHLFDALCDHLQQAARAEELLSAIEASKGRGIADILTERSEGVITDSSIYTAVRALPTLARRHTFHYLTYYVDTDRTYAVLVSKDGDIYQLGPIPISKQYIRDASRFVDPRTWGQAVEYDPSLLVEDTSETLAPLVEVLTPLLEKGMVSVGDHISYSADDSFSNIPLHYLKFRDKRLIDFFSVSRVHNAFHLRQVLTKDAVKRPSRCAAFVVPLQADLTSDVGRMRRENQLRPAAWLTRHLKGVLLENTNVSLMQLASMDMQNKVVQFSTHGIFPRDDEAQNPFRKSGLVLSDGKALPDPDDVAEGATDCLLTPSNIFEMKLKFTNSHVSLMACVSGLSREGLGGDALGMDWAFIQAGAASLLSSHWYVSASLAADFFIRFYERWITGSESRAQAFRNTALSLCAEKGPKAELRSWAAFSLTGDWR
ncbi:CHAT domain-containing protein [Occallatibacter riparius]|uniref:CHAT domain-containing protein n=1 Tax=Occallatibacter riparius TaxID=1002689 RepID=A0A9J7BRE9_9BACT|nr:CHAT domain-containing protein [Occallatibacter riparius]UWZ85248.1 CHAT domain-containing protein [Occallatibacter riparius]